MKNYYLLPVILFMGLSACTTKLNPEDHALLVDTRNIAKQAVNNSMEAMEKSNAALEESKHASKSAEKSAAKADRIFKESQQNK